MTTDAAPALVGTSQLARSAFRRERVTVVMWIVGIVVLVVATIGSIEGLYPTPADLEQAARVSRDNAAAIVFNGPPQGLDTVGGQVAFQAGAFGLVLVGLMSMFMLGRLTRGEEECGRLELLRSLPIDAHAPTAAALAIVVTMNLVVGASVTAASITFGLPLEGSAVFGVSFALFGTFIASVALVATQFSPFARVAYGMTGVVLGLAFALRAIGDIGDGSISWLSPIGWAQKTRPFAGDTWWPFVLLIVGTVALVALAANLALRRDLGAGLVPAGVGRSRGSSFLAGPLALAARLLRASALGWLAGTVVTAAAYGSITGSIKDFIADNEALADLVAARGGADLVDSYLAMSFRILALLAAAFAVQATLRLRNEELAHHADAILATPISRVRWGGSNVTVAVVGSSGLLAAAGLATGVSAALATGDDALASSSVGNALAFAPACWVMVALAMVAVGISPRFGAAVWLLLGYCGVVGVLGQVLELPNWARDVSPFQHVLVPARDRALAPLGVLLLVATILIACGLAGLRRRDIT